MNTVDAAKILKILKISYPTSYKNISVQEANETIETWALMFEEYPVGLVLEAVKSVIKTNVYHPTIAHVQDKINLITSKAEDKRTEVEAWAEVYKAIKVSNYYANESFEKFDPVLKQLVGSPNQLREWAKMEIEKLMTIEKSHFVRSYRNLQEQNKEYKSLPNSTKLMIEKNNPKMLDSFKNIGQFNL